MNESWAKAPANGAGSGTSATPDFQDHCLRRQGMPRLQPVDLLPLFENSEGVVDDQSFRPVELHGSVLKP
jgi:hypothetical protein